MAMQEHGRLKKLLIDTISLLCKNSLKYAVELKIEGVIGITVDTNQVFIVHIDDTNKVEVKEKAYHAFLGSDIYSDGYPNNDQKCLRLDNTSFESHATSTSGHMVARETVLPCSASSIIDHRRTTRTNYKTVKEVDKDQQRAANETIFIDQSGGNENEDDVLCMTIEGDGESGSIDVYRSASYVKEETPEPKRVVGQRNSDSSSNVCTHDDDINEMISPKAEQFEDWNQPMEYLQQSDSLAFKGCSSSSNCASRGRALKVYTSDSVRCSSLGGRGVAVSPAVALRADPIRKSSMSYADGWDGSNEYSRSAVQTRNIDGFSYGKQTVTNYVCNLCSATYKHHCNLLTHQVRVHGRPKKLLGRPPRPKGPTNLSPSDGNT